MAKAEQVLVLNPSTELHFEGPYSEVKKSYLTLINPTQSDIAFKVKTTAPKTYCVRPNGGILKPLKDVTITVMLQPFDPENDDRSKDKFMVQSVYVNEGETNFDSIWHDVLPENLMNSKLKCVFDFSSEPQHVTAAEIPLAPDTVDQVKPKSKVSHVKEEKLSDPDTETKKLIEEFKTTREEYMDLRAENARLKEKGLRLRMSAETRTKPSEPKPESHHPAAKQQLLSNNYLILIGVLVFLLGIYIGKGIL